MTKIIIRYFCLVFLLTAFERQLHGMSLDLDNISETFGSVVGITDSWIQIKRPAQHDETMPLDQPNIQNDIQTPAAAPSSLELVLGISSNVANITAGVPAATAAIIDCKTAMQREDAPVQPMVLSSELLVQQKAEHKRSQEKLKSINKIIHNTGQTLNLFGHTLTTGTYFVQQMTTLLNTVQSNSDDKGKEPIDSPHQGLVTLELQQRKNRHHVKALCNQAIGVINSSGQTVQQLTSFAVQTNNNLQTIEKIITLQNQAQNNRFQPQTMEDMSRLHVQDMEISNNQVRMIENAATTAERLANSVNSLENIAATAQQILESPHWERNMTHTKNNMVKTFGSITCMTVGGILLYKHLMNHVDQKSTILASIGAGLITVPWLISYVDR